MASSDLIGDKCAACGISWCESGDFDRIEVLESLRVHDVDVLDAVIWRVRCNVCLSITEIFHSGEFA